MTAPFVWNKRGLIFRPEPTRPWMRSHASVPTPLQLDGSVDNSVLFELELSGFAKMGETEDSPLKQGKFIFE